VDIFEEILPDYVVLLRIDEKSSEELPRIKRNNRNDRLEMNI
jgi:hypothetical protein